jgi:hypothetical protein
MPATNEVAAGAPGNVGLIDEEGREVAMDGVTRPEGSCRRVSGGGGADQGASGQFVERPALGQP